MYSINKNKIKNIVLEGFNDRQEPFFYLAPDIVGSVATANMDMGKNVFKIDFITTDGRNMKLIVKNDSINNWLNDCQDENSDILDFVKDFLVKSKSEEEYEHGTLEEIVDEFGDIMSDDEQSAINRHVGNSKFDSDITIKQTIPKSKCYYGDLGLGVITWSVVGFIFGVCIW
jgi:hypothetical protein